MGFRFTFATEAEFNQAMTAIDAVHLPKAGEYCTLNKGVKTQCAYARPAHWAKGEFLKGVGWVIYADGRGRIAAVLKKEPVEFDEPDPEKP